jgi:hypothetical protein
MKINKDLIQILTIVIIGMFIPFMGSILINFEVDPMQFDDFLKIGSTFGYFLLIFAFELAVVYLYFQISNKIASKKIDEMKK